MPLLTIKDEYITCPYEPSHQILASRMQFHLVKCEYVNKEALLVRCPFNSTHKVREPEMKHHTNYMCPDRIKVDRYMNLNDATDTPLIPIKPIAVKLNTEESWDDENEATYNPLEHLKDKKILIHKQGVPPSERKLFRMGERQRHQQFQNQECKNKSTEQETPAYEPNPTRLPTTSSKAKSMTENTVNNGNNFGNIPMTFGRGRGRGRFFQQN